MEMALATILLFRQNMAPLQPHAVCTTETLGLPSTSILVTVTVKVTAAALFQAR